MRTSVVLLIRVAGPLAALLSPTYPLGAQAGPATSPSANVEFQVIDEDGHTIEDCYVARFSDRNGVDLASRFHALNAAGVAYGLYRYEIKQRGGWPGSLEGRTSVSAPQLLVVVPTRRSELHGAVADTAVAPGYHMAGKLQPPPSTGGDEPVRVRLIPIYGGSGTVQLDLKVDSAGEFDIFTPLAGRYIAVVIRGSELLGLQQVSFEENGRPATFTIRLADTPQPTLHVTGSTAP